MANALGGENGRHAFECAYNVISFINPRNSRPLSRTWIAVLMLYDFCSPIVRNTGRVKVPALSSNEAERSAFSLKGVGLFSPNSIANIGSKCKVWSIRANKNGPKGGKFRPATIHAQQQKSEPPDPPR